MTVIQRGSFRHYAGKFLQIIGHSIFPNSSSRTKILISSNEARTSLKQRIQPSITIEASSPQIPKESFKLEKQQREQLEKLFEKLLARYPLPSEQAPCIDSDQQIKIRNEAFPLTQIRLEVQKDQAVKLRQEMDGLCQKLLDVNRPQNMKLVALMKTLGDLCCQLREYPHMLNDLKHPSHEQDAYFFHSLMTRACWCLSQDEREWRGYCPAELRQDVLSLFLAQACAHKAKAEKAKLEAQV